MQLAYNGGCKDKPCLDEPMAHHGARMEIVEWKCVNCQIQTIAFYDLDLIVNKSKSSEKLIHLLLNDECFRALCIKKARYERLSIIGYKSHLAKAESRLKRLYGKSGAVPLPHYAKNYLERNEMPSNEELSLIKTQLDKHGNLLLENEVYIIPGMTELIGTRFMWPDEQKYLNNEWPIKNYFFALNKKLLKICKDWSLKKEEYKLVGLLDKRIQTVAWDMLDYSCSSPDGVLTPKERDAKSNDLYRASIEHLNAPYVELIEKPMPKMPSGIFKPYSNAIQFDYYDFIKVEGIFKENEENYFTGTFLDYEVFKLKIMRTSSPIQYYGHSHYLIRHKNDPGHYCIVLLLLEHGDTVVNAFYNLNDKKQIKKWHYLSIRKDYDAELIELAIRQLLSYLLPTHFKIQWNPGANDEPV
jgi:hypothetical protein